MHTFDQQLIRGSINPFVAEGERYNEYRPTYPPEIYSFLFSVASGRNLAWDVGCGGGQVAQVLAQSFKQVIATERSEAQLKNAAFAPNIEYRVEVAEKCSLEDHSVDLITVGEAMHWFRLDDFYREAHRVLKKQGILAAWCYWLRPENMLLNNILKKFDTEIVNAFWLPDVDIVRDYYREIEFPFEEIQAPELTMRALWSVDQLLGYMDTWSASQQFMRVNNIRPTELVRDEIMAIFPRETLQEFTWKLGLRIGRK